MEMAGRKYGGDHQRIRAQYARQLEADGVIPCYRCHRPIYRAVPGELVGTHVPRCRSVDCDGSCWCTWDLGHTDDGTTWHGPEHTCCNRRAGGLNGAAKTNAARARARNMVVRSW
jgi:hypothetical protein